MKGFWKKNLLVEFSSKILKEFPNETNYWKKKISISSWRSFRWNCRNNRDKFIYRGTFFDKPSKELLKKFPGDHLKQFPIILHKEFPEILTKIFSINSLINYQRAPERKSRLTHCRIIKKLMHKFPEKKSRGNTEGTLAWIFMATWENSLKS